MLPLNAYTVWQSCAQLRICKVRSLWLQALQEKNMHACTHCKQRLSELLTKGAMLSFLTAVFIERSVCRTQQHGYQKCSVNTFLSITSEWDESLHTHTHTNRCINRSTLKPAQKLWLMQVNLPARIILTPELFNHLNNTFSLLMNSHPPFLFLSLHPISQQVSRQKRKNETHNE